MTNSTLDRHALILSNISLAEKIAQSRKKKLYHVSFDELKAAAYLGLVQAANSYNSKENDCFPAYAVWRIIGAVRDYLRELSWGTRSKPIKMIFCEELIISYKEENEEENEDLFDNLIQHLPTVNKTVLKLYYQENMKIKEIACNLGVHQSRVSQIMTDSKSRLRNIWKGYQSELFQSAA